MIKDLKELITLRREHLSIKSKKSAYFLEHYSKHKTDKFCLEYLFKHVYQRNTNSETIQFLFSLKDRMLALDLFVNGYNHINKNKNGDLPFSIDKDKISKNKKKITLLGSVCIVTCYAIIEYMIDERKAFILDNFEFYFYGGLFSLLILILAVLAIKDGMQMTSAEMLAELLEKDDNLN